MSERYRVPKRRIRVQLSVCGKEERVTLFLCDFAESHEGPEMPIDLLNGQADFLAVEDERGEIEVLNRDAIALAAMVPASVPPEPGAALSTGSADAQTTLFVTVTLDDGRDIDGFVTYELPESARRLQDFLNGADPFLELRREEDVLVLNKRRIARVRERAATGTAP